MSEGLDVFSKELKPCPFCGRPAKYELTTGPEVYVRVSCTVCEVSTHWKATPSRAAGIWNMRNE